MASLIDICQVYACTGGLKGLHVYFNPDIASGDGIAMAYGRVRLWRTWNLFNFIPPVCSTHKPATS